MKMNDSVIFLLEELYSKNIKLEVLGNNVNIKCSKDVLNNELLNKIKEAKNQIIEIFKVNNIIYLNEDILLNIKDRKFFRTAFSQKSHWCKYKFTKSWVGENGYCEISFSNLDFSIIKKALYIFVKRQEAFRTRYYLIENDIFQEVYDVELKDISLSYLNIRNESNKADKLNELYIKAINTFFNIEAGPLYGFKVIQIDNSEFIVSITVDSSIFDASSISILENEITHIYNALLNQHEINLPPLKSHYKELGLAEYLIVNGIKGNNFRSFHNEYLYNVNSAHLIPTDFPYSSSKLIRNYSDYIQREIQLYGNEDKFKIIPGSRSSLKLTYGAEYQFLIEGNIFNEIETFTKEQGITKYALILSVFFLLFYKLYNTTNEIVIGNCISLRDTREFDNTVGFFTNIIFVKSKIDINTKFSQYVNLVTKDFFKCLAYKAYPWEKNIQENNISYPAISTLFLDYYKNDTRVIRDKKLLNLHKEGAQCIFDLSCLINETMDSIHFRYIYSRELWMSSTIDEHLKIFHDIFKIVLKNPELTIEDILAVVDEFSRTKF